MTKDKTRVYKLARELDLDSKDLLDLCRANGLVLKNQLSSLDPEQRDAIVEWVKRGGTAPARVASAPKTVTPVVPQTINKKVRTIQRTARPAQEPQRSDTMAPAAELTASESEPDRVTAATMTAEMDLSETDTAAEETSPEVETDVIVADDPDIEVIEKVSEDAEQTETMVSGETTDAAALSAKAAVGNDKKIRDLGKPRADREKPRPQTRPIRTNKYNLSSPPTPPKSRSPQEPQKSKERTLAPLAKITPEMKEEMRQGRLKPVDVIRDKKRDAVPVALVDDDEEKKKDKKDKKRRGGFGNREERKKAREERAKVRKQLGGVTLEKGHAEAPEEDAGVGSKRNRGKRGRAPKPKIKIRPEGKISIVLPITVRTLCEALGVQKGPIIFKLLNYGLPRTVNINSTIEPEVAEEIALEEGCELEIKRQTDLEKELLESLSQSDETGEFEPRAPIVTVMGHVDHGKTSLLDKIRQSNVVSTEAGGITQVIRAWRIEHDGRPITFLDTPGHQAFTKMRARGAQVTDIAVIVVAADDGIMPQTEEAINHARAAGVSIVIAINKIDLPNANVNKSRQQLYSMEILPDNMGGDIPFVETSAATGEGIDELLENISLLAELKELTANPNKPAKGICLEAMLSEEEGVQATLLLQEGTMRRGDIIFCGASHGRIRQMYDDLGRSIESAGPSVPVKITGLDAVPNADDVFVVAPDLNTARQIAVRRAQAMQEEQLAPRSALDLLKLSQLDITELKVIIKADFRGSIEAIRKELENLQHDEVRVKILHAATGGISESDVQLALTSPSDTMIVGFNVVPDDRAKALAEEKSIPIREYNVIYMLTDDIKAALEGKLKPRQEVVHLGRAVVRDTFKISRVGTIAGCYVTQGNIKRSAKVRVIRGGAVIYPPPERSAGLDSLKRFKDDTSEVREGFECGLKIAGYDDIKVDDVIEAYRIEEIKRTLDSE